MDPEFAQLITEYQSWLADRTALRAVGDWVEITTPFLDRHNDYIQIYAKRRNGGYLLTDDAATIHDLHMSGCDLETEKRQTLLAEVLNGFHISKDGDALVTEATKADFALRKHSLIQAMLAVGDLFYLAQPYVKSLFFEDVQRWFDSREVRYLSNVKLSGKSGFDYNYEFVIPKSRKRPERLVSTVNSPDKTSAQKVLTAWLDTRDARPPDAVAVAIVNDFPRPPTASFMAALQRYQIDPILWSNRDESAALFVE